MAPFPLFTTATVCIATTVLRSAAEDGIMSPAARRKLGIDNATLPPIEPALVWDAPCTVIEPSPPQTHYMLAFALSTMTSRIWMARAMVRHWLHRHPRLIVSQWHDDDSNSRNDDGIGMRWGIGLTWRGIAPVMCLADALCGRFDWVLFCDDDTVVDVEAVSMLLSNSAAAAVLFLLRPAAVAYAQGLETILARLPRQCDAVRQAQPCQVGRHCRAEAVHGAACAL
mgnify:CR=1 FL=1